MNIVITDWSRFDPMKLGLALAVTLRKQYPSELETGRRAPDALRPRRTRAS